jgi:hypothetical protein
LGCRPITLRRFGGIGKDLLWKPHAPTASTLRRVYEVSPRRLVRVGMDPGPQTNKNKECKIELTKSGPPGQEPWNLILSRCKPKVKNMMAPNFEFGSARRLVKEV